MVQSLGKEVKVVFIPPFWCGVLATLIAEIVAVVIAAIFTTKK